MASEQCYSNFGSEIAVLQEMINKLNSGSPLLGYGPKVASGTNDQTAARIHALERDIVTLKYWKERSATEYQYHPSLFRFSVGT